MRPLLLLLASTALAQTAPDPREIPIPHIQAPIASLPGVRDLPVRRDLPDVMIMDDGTRVKTLAEWRKRREEMRRTLAYYAVGQAPPAPGNVKGREVKSEVVADGKVKYRLVHLTFGPGEKLSLDIGIFTPVSGGPFPAIILQGGTPPGATPLPRLPQGPNQGKGEDVLLMVGPAPEALRPGQAPQPAQLVATQRAELFRRGYALVIYNANDCAEDTTLRNADGSWAFRTTRFYPAYPGYDWGILAGWAWGASRIADYLETDPTIDAKKLIITGASRNGKSSMVAAAFDDRLMGAPVVTGGGGIGAYRFAGPRRSETLDMMQTKYPNWFSPNLREFRGQREKLPFDQHWFLALAAPRPFLALEGETDTISLPEAARQSMAGARPAYALFGAEDRLGVNYAKHGHAFTNEDWTAMLDFFDARLRGRKIDRDFSRFPTEKELDAALNRAKAWTALQAKVTDPKRLEHALAVEAIMRAFGGDEEWALAGLLHDIDIQATAEDLSRHGTVGAQMLRELGFSPAIAHAVEAHDDRAGVARVSPLDHALYCADQLYWFITKGTAGAIPEKLAAECAALPRALETARRAMRDRQTE
jgi:putative nucleotidyltransferase with HDIG domain